MKNQVIWKVQLSIQDKQSIEVPISFTILSVQVQDGFICLWVLVDPGMPINNEIIHIFGTGNPLPDIEGSFIGTCQLDGFVWHVFHG